jgi:two-component system, LytTR family, response regulator
MPMYRSIIVEDEIASQELLSSIITEYCQDIEIVGIASSRDEGVKMILSLKPDIVFMDIQLGDETSFEILEILPNRDFKLIVTTAYTDYALTAFKYEAVDYLLKPFSPKDVIKAVGRITLKLDQSKSFLDLEKVIKNSFHHKEVEKLTISTLEGLTVFKIENITRIEALGAYCKIHARDSKPILLSKGLKEMESLLPSSSFFRVHDSHLINLNHIKEVKKEDGDIVVLDNNDEVPLSRRKKHNFLELLMEFGLK